MRSFMYAFAAFTTMAALSTLAPTCLADTQTDRDHLVGSWVQTGGNNAWVIDNCPDGLHITQLEGTSPVADFQCNTEGQACNVKIGGHKATVSMYYNGPALVQLETKGSRIVKRKFSVLPSGKAMKVEVTPMDGATVQTQELEFERGQPATAKK